MFAGANTGFEIGQWKVLASFKDVKIVLAA